VLFDSDVDTNFGDAGVASVVEDEDPAFNPVEEDETVGINVGIVELFPSSDFDSFNDVFTSFEFLIDFRRDGVRFKACFPTKFDLGGDCDLCLLLLTVIGSDFMYNAEEWLFAMDLTFPVPLINPLFNADI